MIRNILEKTDDKVERQVEEKKDYDRPRNKMELLQEEFHMSNAEIEGLIKFIESSMNNDVLGLLEEMIEYKNLNIRQKVAFAHTLGIFRIEESMEFRIRSSQN